MDFFETVKKRKSIRAFLDKEIEKEKLDKLLETINAAPSAGNLQSYKIALVRNKQLKQAVAEGALRQGFIAQAPLALVFLADKARASSKYGERGANLYALQDATIAAAYAQLTATALGLATVWVGAFETEKIAKLIKATEHEIPVAIIPIGYAAEQGHPKKRRKQSEMVREL